MTKVRKWGCMGFVLPLLLTVQLYAQGADSCMMCHRNETLEMKRNGRSVSLFVDARKIQSSVHATLSCTRCHTGLEPMKIPHAAVIPPVRCEGCHEVDGYGGSVHARLQEDGRGNPAAGCKQCHGTHDVLSPKDPKSANHRLRADVGCGRCHEAVAAQYRGSAHGLALGREGVGSPGCLECHGSHAILPLDSPDAALHKTKEPAFCLKCHLEDDTVRTEVGFPAAFMAGYLDSVHGEALSAGNLDAAGCSDCHGSHDAKAVRDSASRVSRWNVADTCGRCHVDIARTYGQSVHGRAVAKGLVDSPTCTDCHGQHNIYRVGDENSPAAAKNVSVEICASCHDSLRLTQKYGIDSDRFSTFNDSFHGLASRAGALEVANCASCHGVHNILPSSDPASTVHRSNLADTCGSCHPGANDNFARGAVHVIEARNPESGILYWIRAIYLFLITVVIGGMFLHNLLDFIMQARQRRALRAGKQPHLWEIHYERMSLGERLQHAVLMSSFIILAVTGFMLRYPDAWWVAPIQGCCQGVFAVRGALHRIAGFAMIAVSLCHVLYLVFTKKGRGLRRDLWPRWQDARDVVQNLRYLTGLSRRKPLFARFTYFEKIEYWALIWGIMVMAVTGIVMTFDDYFMALWSKLAWDVARTIHFYEAVLAVLSIVIWHFYFVIYSPSTYPMSTVWITGKISEAEMAEHHPLELERLKAAQEEASESA
ncbi:MAG: cytochrome B [Acidobacteria bacterium]|nr:cytochrome B [Acidobacteriota bacterium]